MDARRKQARQQERKRQLRDRSRRRDESQRLEALLLEAECRSGERDWPAAERALLKVLVIRPGQQEARERLVHVYAATLRPADALAAFERLGRPPEWPLITFLAADAAITLERLEQASELAQRFLAEARGSDRSDPVLQQARHQARLLDKRARAMLAIRTRTERAASRRAGREDSAGHVRREDPAERAGGETPAGHGENGRPGSVVEATPAAPASGSPSASGSPPAPGPLSMPAAPPRSPGPDVDATGPAADAAAPAAQPPLPPFADAAVALPPPVFDIPSDLLAANFALPPATLDEARFTCRYAALRLERGFDQLLALRDADVTRLWYQVETVRRTLRDFRGRVLLADEVGLGKTIEACLVLKEYWRRGLARRALVLTPPSLVSQWVDELQRRVHLDAVTPESGGYAHDPDGFWTAHPLVVASTALARQPANRERLAALDYDLVIVDEAHELKNRSTAAWQTVNAIKKRFLLLLSATPVGNDLTELYNLILLLRPGLLSTEARFKREYGRAGALADAARRERLRALLREVMVRNTRAHIDLKLPRRLAATTRVTPGPVEARLLEGLDVFVRERYAVADRAERWALMTLQMQAGSGPQALAEGLSRFVHGSRDRLDTLAREAQAIERPAKTDALVALLARSPEKKIVFTRFLATLHHLHGVLTREGCRVAVYHGGLTRAQKDRAVAEFEGPADVLLASEVGGEGRNLQFCRTVVNFDLPWNPMAIEQRVGRVHRIGQAREVYVFNFCLAGSVEDYVLRVLHDKINLFELVAGEMEMILGELDDEADFATLVMDRWAASATAGERDHAFDDLAATLAGAKHRYDERTALDRNIFREDYEV